MDHLSGAPNPSDGKSSSFLFLTQTPKTFTARKPVAGRKVRGDKAKNAHVQQGYWQARKNDSTRKLKWKRAVLVRDERGLRLSSKSKSRSPNPPTPVRSPARFNKRITVDRDPSQPQSTCPSPKMPLGGTSSSFGSFQIKPTRGKIETKVAHDLPIGRLYKSSLPIDSTATDIVRVERPRSRPIDWTPYSGPTTPLDTSYIDPFATATLPITRDMNLDIMHCTTYMFPVIYQFDVQAQSCIQMWLELAFSYPSLLYSVLAATLLHRRAVMSLPVFQHMTAQIDRQFLHYKVMAIQMINKSLSNPEEAFLPSTLWAIVAMLSIENIMGTEAEMLPHRLGVLRILNLRGGLEGLPTVLLDGLLPTLHWASYWTSLKPQYPPPPNGIPLTASTISRVRSALPTTPFELSCTGFNTLEVTPFLNAAMRQGVQDLQDNIHFREAHMGGGWGATLEEVEHINYQAHRGRYVLLAQDPSDFSSPEMESISIALATFTAATDEFFDPASPILRSLIPRLKTALQKSDLRFFWKPAHEALVWVLSIGAFQSAGEAERPWFILQLARGVQVLDVKSEEELKWLLTKFCYVDRLYASSLGQVWQEVEMMMEALPRQWHN